MVFFHIEIPSSCGSPLDSHWSAWQTQLFLSLMWLICPGLLSKIVAEAQSPPLCAKINQWNKIRIKCRLLAEFSDEPKTLCTGSQLARLIPELKSERSGQISGSNIDIFQLLTKVTGAVVLQNVVCFQLVVTRRANLWNWGDKVKILQSGRICSHKAHFLKLYLGHIFKHVLT